ncbi:carboxylesterase protein [Salinisphaera shabanensis E1L3A]|jgi:pimeloyl-ACP methyl ester carboxylesterase|uniref:Carboxylesterase protein n=1 Tax=Salinisphaera shabanensis E1L3A TaxID=1033802 RepID=U2EQT3_9GAMM|nr:alpha/beta hydrolase [Salinisphaera shabanensis]ERJ20407.1 carboxylesterase protein [Salinisphaera shabanensis E1L3A]
MTEFLAPALDGADFSDRVEANGLELAYEQFGRDEHPALLLIMGLGTQLTGWPDAFCRALADTGLRVIRFDNRDIGLSSQLGSRGPRYDGARTAFMKSLFGRRIRTAYTLDDMAADTVALMDALGIEQAHLVGASMGGMIAQLVTARHPKRVLTLTSIMSTSGARRLPRGRMKVLMRLGKAPRNNDPDTVARHMAKTMRMIGSPDYGRSLEDWTSEIRRNVKRSYRPAGSRRQMLAVMAAPSRVEMLREITQPALVIHGKADPLLPVKHGRDTARHLPNVRYEEVEGMGHDLPPRLLPSFVEWIAELVHGDNDERTD